MNLALQVIVVALVVIACATYSIWRLLSAAARVRVLERLAKVPAVSRTGWYVRLSARTRGGTGAGCGGCAASTTAASRKQTPGALRR